MGSSPALIQEHDKVAIARHIAMHSVLGGIGPVGGAIGDIAIKKAGEVVGQKKQNFKFSSHLKGRLRY